MRISLCILISIALGSASANATSLSFIQDGWSPGGPLSVMLSGDDTNADGTLEQSEINVFRASWVTPIGNITTWTLPDIQPDGILFTDLDNYLFFTRNEDYSLVSTAFEGEALASIFDVFLFPVSSSASSPAAVPEPSNLFAAGLATLSLWKLCQRSKKTEAAVRAKIQSRSS
ncbi:MAG TPA: hypothetical protein VEX68_15860 [Bryobacteraceae bacterium]|nr:hypothetical protein [Bryobacteraceae bacterium]